MSSVCFQYDSTRMVDLIVESSMMDDAWVTSLMVDPNAVSM